MHYVIPISGEKKILNSGVVPSIFTFKPGTGCVSERDERSTKRRRSSSAQPTCSKRLKFEDISDSPVELHVGAEETVTVETLPPNNFQPVHVSSEKAIPTVNDVSAQCLLLTGKINFTVDSFFDKPNVIKYYTGFNSYDHFMLLFTVLGDCVNHLYIKDCHLLPKDQLFLTLIKLRLAKDDFELSILFNLRPNTVSNVTLVWIKFLYYQLRELDFVPPKEVVDEHMPQDFKLKFPNTRMIIDGTEIPIQKPKKVDAQSVTFSSYKNKNTLKVLVGCSPRGLVSYVSSAYGGSASDRQICERSELLTNDNMFQKGDSIMADRGFNVQDLFASKDVKVNMPTFMKGKSQLSASDVVKDRCIASKRIHVERVIGLAKTFKILKKELPAQRVVLGDFIISVCFYLVNFKNAIIGRNM